MSEIEVLIDGNCVMTYKVRVATQDLSDEEVQKRLVRLTRIAVNTISKIVEDDNENTVLPGQSEEETESEEANETTEDSVADDSCPSKKDMRKSICKACEKASTCGEATTSN